MGNIRTTEPNQGLQYPFGKVYIQIHCHTSVTQIPKRVGLRPGTYIPNAEGSGTVPAVPGVQSIFVVITITRAVAFALTSQVQRIIHHLLRDSVLSFALNTHLYTSVTSTFNTVTALVFLAPTY